MEIRKATATDIDVVYDFICDLEGEKLDYTAFSNMFADNINNDNISYLVAIDDIKTVGFISLHIQKLLHHTAPIGEIQELYISPAIRGQGCGAQLIQSVVEIAKQKGCTQIEVTCNQKRTRTHKFYTANGFDNTHFKFCRKI